MSLFLERLGTTFGRYFDEMGPRRLNLGCGRLTDPDWINIDRVGGPGVTTIVDLEHGWLPYEAGTVDGVLAVHVLEHIRNLMPLVREVHRVLKPGAPFLIVTPHASSDDAWEDPTHVRSFTERSWMYFDQRTYQNVGNAGCYDSGVDYTFVLEFLHLIPFEHWNAILKEGKNNLEFERRTYRNVIQEMRVVLRKVAV